jgi:hypothetical protein
MSTSLLGYDMPSPIIVAPTGSHKLANPEGLKTQAYKFRMLKYGIQALLISLHLMFRCIFQGRWLQQELQHRVTA